jgi:hypothetical protein
MVFADWQLDNEQWKPSKKVGLDPVKARKIHLCFKCLEKGYRVKMDYILNKHEKGLNCVYNVDYYKCPRCLQVYKEQVRIVGKGKTRNNLGKIMGGE